MTGREMLEYLQELDYEQLEYDVFLSVGKSDDNPLRNVSIYPQERSITLWDR